MPSNVEKSDSKQFEEMAKDFETELEKLRQNVNRLDDSSNRLLGPSPVGEDSDGKTGDSRSDFAYDMQRKIDALRALNSEFDGINSRLESAI